jgi:hypothetical protein
VFRAVAFCLRYRGKRWLSYSIYKKRQETGKSRINLTPQLRLLRGQIISRHKKRGNLSTASLFI